MLVIWWRRGELRWELLPPSDREAMQVWMIEEAIEQARRAPAPLVKVEVVLHRPPPPPRREMPKLLGKFDRNKHRAPRPRKKPETMPEESPREPL